MLLTLTDALSAAGPVLLLYLGSIGIVALVFTAILLIPEE